MIDKNALFLLLLIPLYFLYRGKPEDPVPSWDFRQDAIQINYIADEKLNSYNGRPHTLILVMYQLSDSAPFNEKSRLRDGLSELLLGEHFDPSVVGIDRFIIQPGDKETISIDRLENTRRIGIVAGYYKLEPKESSKTFEIEYHIEEKGHIRKKKTAVIENIRIFLNLGPEGILKAGSM